MATLEYLILGYRENLETSIGKLIIHLITHQEAIYEV